MSDKTSIEWTATRHPDGTVTPGSTWNPIRGTAGNRWMCRKISPGCDNCYASRLNKRFGGAEYPREGTALMVTESPGADPRGEHIRLDERVLTDPLRWKKPRRVFVCSMTDLFGEWVPDEWLDRVFGLMAHEQRHTFQVLTKRPSRMQSYLAGAATRCLPSPVRTGVSGRGPVAWMTPREPAPFPLPNVWLGTSIEMDRYAWRARVLADIPAAVRFVSAEPLLGPLPSLRFDCPCGRLDCAADHSREEGGRAIHWLITGGESAGPAERRLVERCDHQQRLRLWGAEMLSGERTGLESCRACNGTGWRPKPEALGWVRELRSRAKASGVAFFHKQWGGVRPTSGGRLLDGRTWDEMPTAREVI